MMITQDEILNKFSQDQGIIHVFFFPYGGRGMVISHDYITIDSF